jgi:uncharacterized repeat protein (TIGR01451 family)
VTAGNNLTYTITVENAGPSDAAAVAVSDPLPAGTSFVSASDGGTYNSTTNTVSWSLGAFTESQAAKALTLVVKVNSSRTADLSNTATVSSSTTDPTPGNNSATETTTLNTSANLSITKSNSPDPVIVGNNLTYTITVDNAGPSDAAAVAVSDPVPAGTSFVSASDGGTYNSTTNTLSWSLGAFTESQAAKALTLVIKVNSRPAGGSISNTATVSSTTTDPTSGNNSATAITTVNKRPTNLDLTGTATQGQYSDPVGLKATLTDVTDAASPTPIAGETITFTMGTQTFTATTDANGVARTGTTVPDRINQPQGAKSEAVTYAGNPTYATKTVTGSYTVNRENATVTGIQPTAVALTSTNDVDNNGNVDSIQLVATVQEDTSDGYPSSALGGTNGVTLAQPITLSVSSVSKGATWGFCQVMTLTLKANSSDTATGSCSITNVPVDVYQVDALIGNYFTGGGASALDVYNPALGFATGGGWFMLADGTKVNFGFTAKYLKSNQIQGSLLTIFHRKDGNYIIKSNAMGVLAVNQSSTTPPYWTATLTGKATYQIPSGTLLYCGTNKCGNYAFTMYAEDKNEPGAGTDTYTLQVKDPNTGLVVGQVSTWLSGGGVQNAVTITGGNIQIPHS